MLALAASVIVVAVSVVAQAIGAAIPAALLYDDEFTLRDTDLARLVLVLGNHWLAGAAASVAALVVAALVAGRASRLFPRWLVWGGFVVAVVLLLSMAAFAGITFVALAVWTVIVSVRLLRAPRVLAPAA